MLSTNAKGIGKWALFPHNWMVRREMKKKLIAFCTGFLFLLFHDIHSFHKIINLVSALKQY